MTRTHQGLVMFAVLFGTWTMVMIYALVEDRSFYLLWRLYSFWKGLT